MSVSCECCVSLGRGLCDVPIPRPEESYRLWCVIVCDLETSRIRRPWPPLGCCVKEEEECSSRCVKRGHVDVVSLGANERVGKTVQISGARRSRRGRRARECCLCFCLSRCYHRLSIARINPVGPSPSNTLFERQYVFEIVSAFCLDCCVREDTEDVCALADGPSGSITP